MEVMVEVSSVPAYVSVTAQDKQSGQENGGGATLSRFSGRRVGSGERAVRSEKPEASSESSSSLGNPSEEEEDDEEVSSGGCGGHDVVSGNGGLGSLGSLEDSLPFKRGLSNCFAGRSKSFANLSEVKRVEDLGKEEKPFNKRRRTLIASKLLSSRKSSGFYSWQTPNSMPLLALKENPNPEEEEDDDDDEEESNNLHQSKLNTSFKSTSCFSLTDL